jgi:phosphatidylglycerol---prolipoprotein diacylglyceryl transferase
VSKLAKVLGREPAELRSDDRSVTVQFAFDHLNDYESALVAIKKTEQPADLQTKYDTLWDTLVHHWPRGEEDLKLKVQHANGEQEEMSFTPRTIGLHPTQVYESISMFLLFLLLNAFFPFRRHYGEVFVLLMICYALHRFVNETLRNDTDPVAYGMTLSQNGSIICGLIGVALFVWLWRRPVDKGLEPPDLAATEGPTAATA